MSTTPGEVRSAAESFLSLLERSTGSPDQDLQALVDLLDRLPGLARRLSFPFEDGPDPPDTHAHDYARFDRLSRERFPSLGLYNLPRDISNSVGNFGWRNWRPWRQSTGLSCGYAHDDIADSACDFSGVLWCFAHASENVALWHFRWGYEAHWGKHLSDLRWYLYALENRD